MSKLPFNPHHPPDEPPPDIALPMLWRVAIRLYRDHDRTLRDRMGALTCRLCRQPWPCLGRRLAHRGLAAAVRPVPRPSVPRPSVPQPSVPQPGRPNRTIGD